MSEVNNLKYEKPDRYVSKMSSNMPAESRRISNDRTLQGTMRSNEPPSYRMFDHKTVSREGGHTRFRSRDDP